MAPSSQAAQAGLLQGGLLPAIFEAYNQLDVTNLGESLPAFTAQVAVLTQRYGAASGTLASRAYLADRAAAGIHSTFTPRIAPLPELAQIGKTVNWAIGPLYSAQPDTETARTNLDGSVARLVQNVGRQTIVDSVQADRKARGWAREVEPGACSFCALLATRGAVYRSERSASFSSHDHCRCQPVPVFGAYEPTAQVREWQALYRTSTAGLRGAAARNAFRQALAPAAS